MDRYNVFWLATLPLVMMGIAKLADWSRPFMTGRCRPRVCKNVLTNPCYDFWQFHRKGIP